MVPGIPTEKYFIQMVRVKGMEETGGKKSIKNFLEKK